MLLRSQSEDALLPPAHTCIYTSGRGCRSRAGVAKLWSVSLLPVFVKKKKKKKCNCNTAVPCPFAHLLFVTAFALQSRISTAETIWPTKPKILPFRPFTENVCCSLVQGICPYYIFLTPSSIYLPCVPLGCRSEIWHEGASQLCRASPR